MTATRNAAMLLARCAWLFALALSICTSSANAAPRKPTTRDAMRNAMHLLEKSRRASGRGAWNRIQNIHFTAVPNAPAAFESAEEWIDLPGERVRQSMGVAFHGLALFYLFRGIPASQAFKKLAK